MFPHHNLAILTDWAGALPLLCAVVVETLTLPSPLLSGDGGGVVVLFVLGGGGGLGVLKERKVWVVGNGGGEDTLYQKLLKT